MRTMWNDISRRNFVTVIGVSVGALGLDARDKVLAQASHANEATKERYVFNESFPPLLKDNYDVRSISAESLKQNMGMVHLKPLTDTPVGVVNGHMKIVRRFHDLEISRYKYWAIKDVVFHPVADYARKLEITTGFDVSRKSEFEKTTSFDGKASAGPSFFNFTADMKDALKIDDSFTSTWKEEIKETTEQTFKANYTYVTWCLYDEMRAVHNANLQLLDTPGMNVMQGLPPEHSESVLNCVLNTYQDAISDADRK